ncbi:MFS transporter [Nocardia yamanashiensis]|uniref:MFS transporter n=1 Tax=Nocardia yamanashiensis TaxID=209247 RepID=UPI001E4A0A3A|nr:MFS transporter [Nocardia yamanashiensis]UGT45363.1 MFS transporter [Nocardia yamanashiensis]
MSGGIAESACTSARPVRLRGLAWQVFVPTVVFGMGAGAAAPMYPLRALELGATAGPAGLVVALSGFGMILADLPAGQLIARIGERRAIAGSSVCGAIGVLLAIFAPNLGVLAVGILCTGAAAALWGLARQTYLVAVVSPGDRGRALSALAGSQRFGTFAGPFAGAGAAQLMDVTGTLWLQLVAMLVAGALMMSVRDIEEPDAVRYGLWTVLTENRRALGTLGLGALTTGAARAARTALVPLWAAHIGMSAATIGLIFGIAGAVDVLMSYPSGIWLDRYGRRATGTPALVLFAIGYAVLPLTSTAAGLCVVAVLLGFANGLSNGLIMTVGTDIAPAAQRVEFLGAWRLTHDFGMFTGPIAVGVIGGATALGGAGLALGALSLAGAASIYRWFPGRSGLRVGR